MLTLKPNSFVIASHLHKLHHFRNKKYVCTISEPHIQFKNKKRETCTHPGSGPFVWLTLSGLKYLETE